MAASVMSFAALHQQQQQQQQHQQQQPVIRIMRNPTFTDVRQQRRLQLQQVRHPQPASITVSRHASLQHQTHTPRTAQLPPPANQQQFQFPPKQVPISFPHLCHPPHQFDSHWGTADRVWTSTEQQIRKRFQLSRESTGLTATFKSHENKTQLADIQQLPADSSFASMPTSTRWATKQSNDRRLAVKLESVDEELHKTEGKQKVWSTSKGISKKVETSRDQEVHRALPDAKDPKSGNESSVRLQRQWDATAAGKLNLMPSHLVAGDEVNRKLLRRRSNKKWLDRIRAVDVFTTNAMKLKATSITGSSEENCGADAKRTNVEKDNCKKEMTITGRELDSGIDFAEGGPEVTVTGVRHSNDVTIAAVSAADFNDICAFGEKNRTKNSKRESEAQPIAGK
jgi:hypothetical protein